MFKKLLKKANKFFMSNEPVLITEETLTLELETLGYQVGDEMPTAPVIGEEDYTVDEAFLEANPSLVGTEGYALGDVIKRPVLGEIPAKVVSPVVEEKKEEPVVETPVAPSAPAEPRKFYEGKVVISDGTREVNGITYHAIRLEDGSTYDLTAEDYKMKVKVEEL